MRRRPSSPTGFSASSCGPVMNPSSDMAMDGITLGIDESIGHYRAAALLYRAAGDRTGEGRALDNLGYACTYCRTSAPSACS